MGLELACNGGSGGLCHLETIFMSFAFKKNPRIDLQLQARPSPESAKIPWSVVNLPT